MVIDHGPFEAQLHHATFQLSNGRLDVLHRQRGQSGEAVGVVDCHLVHFVIAGACNGGGGGDVLIVLVEGDIGGHDLNVDPEGFHIGQTLLLASRRSWD